MSDAATATADQAPLIIGRYALFDALASGGMATVHLGRLLGAEGFGRTVAVKRLHSHYTTDQDFITMFMDEARIVARIRHPNVVPMVDVIESSKGLFLVMEYVHGEAFSKLLRTCRTTSEPVPTKVATAIMHGVLLGLHAAHETKGVNGELLDVVHRDVSPQNIIVGADGVARVLDFGVAKAAGRAQITREGQIKGKLAYMAPEQIRGKVDRRADIFAAAVVLWEALTGRRLHDGAKDVEIVTRVVKGDFKNPSEVRSDLPANLDAIVMQGLAIDVASRYQTAREMAIDLERKIGLASPSEVGEWVERLASDALRERAELVLAMEKVSGTLAPAESVPPAASPDAFSDVPMPELSALLHGDAGRPSSGNFATDTGFSSTGTPLGTEMPAEMVPPRRDMAPVVALVSFCGALALVGAALGGYSLYARRTAPAPAMSSAPTARASAPPLGSVQPRIEPPPTEAPSAAPEPTSASPTSASPTSAPEADDAGAGAGPAATQAPAPTQPAPTQPAPTQTPPAPTQTQQPAPTYRPPPSAPAPAPKKNCDPPYTVDEQGHKKYKLECLNGD